VQHEREGEWGEGKDHAWSTDFYVSDYYSTTCNFCSQRLQQQLKSWEALSPDHTISVLFTSALRSAVEFKFVDTEDGMSEWTYWFWHEFDEEERKTLGSTV
jgi:hypothetical protein